jgi:hypothetical protein
MTKWRAALLGVTIYAVYSIMVDIYYGFADAYRNYKMSGEASIDRKKVGTE